jgi:hypothetical protein
MSYQEQQIFQRLAAMQGIQAKTNAATPEEDLETLYQEATALIQLIGPEPDSGSLEDLEDFWGPALSGFGEEWEDILDYVLDEAEVAASEGRPYHHNGYMYWYVLERCYELLKEDEATFQRELFRECLSCLRATRTFHESLAREEAEKRAYGHPG